MIPDPKTETTEGAGVPKYRIWVAHCPFKKNGAPSLGTFGRSIDQVVVFRLATWKRLCEAIPELGTTQFEVGTDE